MVILPTSTPTVLTIQALRMLLKEFTIFIVLAITLPSQLVNGRLKAQWCFRYREVFMELGCNGQRKGENFFCTLLEVMFRQDNIGDPPCLFYPCTGWGQSYPRDCLPRSDCSADHIQALGICTRQDNVCCRSGKSGKLSKRSVERKQMKLNQQDDLVKLA
ncbi:hypothetical protein RRG08_012980 [Elysia crispata]|uniref:Uncharacterized protein n=1 Tax=Elysia crispata TaxID=231223 RepID=A0AAE1DR79_9GAST|nr:hypothetical protein RRG08_012980 [Elysia crispata]